MLPIISSWLTEQGISAQYNALATLCIGLILMMLLASTSYYLAKHKILTVIERWVKQTKNTWDDIVLEQHVFTRLALLVPIIVLWFLIPHLLNFESSLYIILIVCVKVAITFQVARIFDALLNVIKSIYRQSATERYLPLNSAIQVIKLIIYLIATILSISYVLDKSPLYLLSGLGALTAVLLLVFQDTIKGLVASIQISANKMLAPGDWIEIPQYGADGDVLEIGLNTVKVQNFDRTITTVPTYALISGSFKNWRGMYASGARRIKRNITVDVASIRFYKDSEVEALKSFALLSDYLAQKQQSLAEFNSQNVSSENCVNQRQLTNIGTYRAYIEAYLAQHAMVRNDMTCMVRQLPASATGLPLELYFFSAEQDWVAYEGIQADIFDHLYAIAKHFDVRIFQHPSGEDWRQLR